MYMCIGCVHYTLFKCLSQIKNLTIIFVDIFIEPIDTPTNTYIYLPSFISIVL